MFGILARSLNIATRTEKTWDAPSSWTDQDRRTFAEKKRDLQDQRRWLRQTGIL